MHNKLLRPITTIAGLDCLSNEQISKIRLQEAVDFTIYTEFDDEDLIELWKEFLYSIRAARLFKKSSVRTVGGGRRVDTTLDCETITIVFRDVNIMEYQQHNYYFESELDLPFEKTYRISIERHGTKSIFG